MRARLDDRMAARLKLTGVARQRPTGAAAAAHRRLNTSGSPASPTLRLGLALALAFALAPTAAAAQDARELSARAAWVAVAGAQAEARSRGERAFEVQFSTPLLAFNVQGNSGAARAVVRLPLSGCRAKAPRCWLLLYLPGFDADPAAALSESSLGGRLDTLERAGAAPPIVAAAVDGRTRLGGGFYADSPSSGRFASVIFDALLPALRKALGTDLPPERTVILGHSMGGYGALALALARPKEFSGVGALSPAVHVDAQATRLLAWVQAQHPLRAPDPAAMVREPDPARFQERLLWAMCAAFDPAPVAPQGFRWPFDPESRPWRLTPSARAAFARADLATGWDERRRASARALGRVFVASGTRDSLVPPSDVEPLIEALGQARDGAPTRASFHGGDHLNRLGPDFEDAVLFLTSTL